jgi:hypothetical protein
MNVMSLLNQIMQQAPSAGAGTVDERSRPAGTDDAAGLNADLKSLLGVALALEKALARQLEAQLPRETTQ